MTERKGRSECSKIASSFAWWPLPIYNRWKAQRQRGDRLSGFRTASRIGDRRKLPGASMRDISCIDSWCFVHTVAHDASLSNHPSGMDASGRLKVSKAPRSDSVTSRGPRCLSLHGICGSPGWFCHDPRPISWTPMADNRSHHHILQINKTASLAVVLYCRSVRNAPSVVLAVMQDMGYKTGILASAMLFVAFPVEMLCAGCWVVANNVMKLCAHACGREQSSGPVSGP